jgi:serine protease Do
VFTTDGLLAGLVFEVGGRPAMIPGEVLLSEATRLPAPPAAGPVDIGVAVQALTPPVAKATGSPSGVVVAWVSPQGAAADVLEVGDVIEAVDDAPVRTPLEWQVRTARATAGQPIKLAIRRQGDEVGVMLDPEAAPTESTPLLGLSMRAQAGAGALITDVQPGSAADRAGLRAGDIITLVADISTPSPAAVRTAFARATAETAILVAYTRASTHHVTALAR